MAMPPAQSPPLAQASAAGTSLLSDRPHPGRPPAPAALDAPPRRISPPPDAPGPLAPARPRQVSAPLASALLGPLPRPQSLPGELLCRIFSYLPATTRSQCALVCRHWYANLPDPRMRAIGQWITQGSLYQRSSESWLASAYSCRISPWLERLGCELLPRLQAWQQEPQAAPSFPGFLRYCLDQQIRQTRHLALEPATISGAAPLPVRTFCFSPCGRWFATECLAPSKTRTKTDVPVMRIHGWNDNGWQEELVPPAPKRPPSLASFCCKPAATIISFHNREIMVWQRAPDDAQQDYTRLYRHWPASTPFPSGHWNRTRLYKVDKPYALTNMKTTNDGDLIVLCCNQQSGWGARLLFFSPADNERNWGQPRVQPYTKQPVTIAWAGDGCQLALALATPRAQLDQYDNAVHLWSKNRDADHPSWSCRVYSLLLQDATLKHMKLSPDGHYLLIGLSDGRFALLNLDTRHQPLRERYITLDCPLSQPAEKEIFNLYFLDNSQQLIVPCCRWGALALYKGQDGCWREGDKLSIPAVAGDLVHTTLLGMIQSTDGRTLMRVCTGQVDIYYLDNADRWMHVVHRRIANTGDPPPLALFLPPSRRLCLTVSGPQGELWINGPDDEGQFVRKATFCVGKPVLQVRCSPDGLSLRLQLQGAPPLILQLTGVPGTQPARQIAQQDARQHCGQAHEHSAD
ncbi:MAG: F-box protein [Kistimonas sp.]|nr:F-box protein [Kistimonas sp.]